MTCSDSPTPFTLLKPSFRAARDYSLFKFRKDLIAGATVAAIAVPQGMAYAVIAQVAPVYGLITVIVQSIITALFNSNRFLSVGPINTQSLLVASVAGVVARKVAPGDGDIYLQIVILLALVKGMLQLVFAAVRLGNLVRYVSVSVTTGFTAGAGVLIAVNQVGAFLGMRTAAIEQPLPGILGSVQRLVMSNDGLSWRSIVIGVLSLVIVIGGRRISKLFPGPLLAIIGTGLLVVLAGWQQSVLTITPLPPFSLPLAMPAVELVTTETLESILIGGTALALLGLLEAYSIGRSIADRTGERISANGELISQGMSNLLSSFFQCIPGSGSFSRSELNYQAGAETLFAGVFNALLVLAVFVLFADYARFIPMASLAAILFVVAWGLINWRFFLRVRKASRIDAVVCGVTFLSTLLMPLQYAVYIGILLNIGLYLHKASRLHLSEMIQAQSGPFIERPIRDRFGTRRVLFLQLEGNLFFGVADELRDRLSLVLASEVRVVIFRLKRTHMVDATVMTVLEWFVKEMHRRHCWVILCGVREDLMRAFRAYGLTQLIGDDNVFPAGDNVFASAKAALARARDLVAQSIDLAPLHEELSREGNEEALTYEI